MNAAIRDYARKLSITDAHLKRLERQYRMAHGPDAEAKLTSYLTRAYDECKDRAFVPAQVAGYVEVDLDNPHVGRSMPQEPESPDPAWLEERARLGWVNFGVVKGEEQARREARSRAERLRQAEIELRQKGRSAEQHAKTVEDAIAAMKREAAA